MIRVAFILDGLEVGGHERCALSLLERLDRDRFTSFVYSFRTGQFESAFRKFARKLRIQQPKPGLTPEWTPEDADSMAAHEKQLPEQLQEDQIDAVIVFGLRYGAAAAAAAGIEAIIERVGGPSLVSKVQDKSKLKRVVCDSRIVEQLVRSQSRELGCEPSRAVYVPNGVDLGVYRPPRPQEREQARKALGLEASDFVVGTVTRLDPIKNLHLLLDGFMRFSARRPEARLLVVGPDGGERGSLERRVADAGLEDRIQFLGHRSDTRTVLWGFDVFTLTSFSEGMSNATLEAIATGLPIVTTPVGGFLELNRGNGFFVGVDQPTQLRNVLFQLCDSVELRARLGRESRGLAARAFDVQSMIRRYESLLDEVVLEDTRRPIMDVPPEIVSLVRKRGRISEARSVSPRPTSGRASCYFRLHDGLELKGRRVESSAQADQIAHVTQRLFEWMTPVLDRDGPTLLEPWIPGTTAHDDEKVAIWAGEFLGRLSTLPYQPPPRRPSAETLESFVLRNAPRLTRLISAGLISSELESRAHDWMGRQSFPFPLGWVHSDVCLENIIQSTSGRYVLIDNESIDVGPPALSLVATLLRWPMNPSQRAALIDGFGRFGSISWAASQLEIWTLECLLGSLEFDAARGVHDSTLIAQLALLIETQTSHLRSFFPVGEVERA